MKPTLTRTAIVGGALVAVLVLLALAIGHRAFEQPVNPLAPTPRAIAPTQVAAAGLHQDFLYGRITTWGAIYEGRLRFGGDQEAFWGDYFNGFKPRNPWLRYAPPERRPKERRPIEIFGFSIPPGQTPVDLGRHFMARFGDIARIEGRGRVVRVTLKSGTVFDLDRFGASDYDDGVRVWDRTRGVVDLKTDIETEFLARIDGSRRVRTIELLPTPRLGAVPDRLHGTVRTALGDFTGFLQWDRQDSVGTDTLDGRTAEGERSVRYDTIRSIARRSRDSALVTLVDGREIVLFGTREVTHSSRGVYVDDPRYGRVLVSWDAFERVDFRDGGGGPAYWDFPPGRPLTGIITTRAGQRLVGRIVYDLDESEITETLDAPLRGVDYTIPFGMISSVAVPGREAPDAHVRVRLHNGEELQLERAGDLGGENAGMLVFMDGERRPRYVAWNDVQQVDLDRPPATYPPLGGSKVETGGPR